MKIHTLANNATVISLSPHPFRFSDGTVAEAQSPEVVQAFTLARRFSPQSPIKGMGVNRVEMILSPEQFSQLGELCKKADIVILPFPVLSALREQGVRDQFPNALAFNATPETQRSQPDQKVVDINNWSY